MGFIKERMKKEISGAKRIWRGFLILCIFWFGLIGLSVISTKPEMWYIGVIFITGAVYIGYRLGTNKKGVL